MTISIFRDKFVTELRLAKIPGNMSTEMQFERDFVIPLAYETAGTERDVQLFSHPWGVKKSCEPDCESALKGIGHREPGCNKCWANSKAWASVDAFGTHNNFDLVGKGKDGAMVAVEIKLVKVKEGRMPNGEIQRFFGQCALASSKFDFVIGICGYQGTLNPKYDQDTDQLTQWAKGHKIDLIFRSTTAEKFGNYEIEWITIPSFREHHYGKEFHYYDSHGVILSYRDASADIPVGFINGYEWLHEKRGPCKIYILDLESSDWHELLLKAKQILAEVKEASYEVIGRQLLRDRIKDNIYALANA